MTDELRAGTDHDELSAYLDDELNTTERAAVEQRLVESPALLAELDEVRAARDAMRGLATRDAPVGFWDEVIAGVRDADIDAIDDIDEVDEPAAVVDLDARRRRLRRAGVFAGAAAAAAAIIAVVLVPGRTSVRPNVTAVATQHAASSSDVGDSISSLAPVGPLVGRR
jgi:anti-sigma factor RsiW